MRRTYHLVGLLILTLVSVSWAEPATKTFTNESWGYSVSYPADSFFISDPEMLRRFQREGLDAVADSSVDKEKLLKDVGKITGQQFAVIYGPEDVTSLNLLIERVGVPGITNKSYYEAAMSQLSRIKVKLTGEPSIIEIHGREYYAQDYDMPTPKGVMKARFYSHYDPKEQLAYVSSVVSFVGRDTANFQALEKVMMTFKIEDMPDAPSGGPST